MERQANNYAYPHAHQPCDNRSKLHHRTFRSKVSANSLIRALFHIHPLRVRHSPWLNSPPLKIGFVAFPTSTPYILISSPGARSSILNLCFCGISSRSLYSPAVDYQRITGTEVLECYDDVIIGMYYECFIVHSIIRILTAATM